MELDDLKTAWQTLGRQLERHDAIHLTAVRTIRLQGTRGTLRRLMVGQAAQIAIWVTLIALVIAPFWVEHRATTHLLVLGLVLHAYAVLTIIVSVMQLLLMARIDLAGPVLTIQQRLVQLRALRIRLNLLLTLPWWPLWVVALVVGVQRWMGVDLYAAATGWFYATLAVGIVALVATVAIARRLAARALRMGRPAPMADDLAGHSLRRAIVGLEDLASFERE